MRPPPGRPDRRKSLWDKGAQPATWSGRSSRTTITPFLGAKPGFRRAVLCAGRAGWLCKASRGAGEGGVLR